MMSEVAVFIRGFDPVKDFFLHGYCYWFAVILRQMFDGVIYYLPIENHFITLIGDYYWDAGGVVNVAEAPVLWDRYKQFDPLETQRIIRDCIRKEVNV